MVDAVGTRQGRGRGTEAAFSSFPPFRCKHCVQHLQCAQRCAGHHGGGQGEAGRGSQDGRIWEAFVEEVALELSLKGLSRWTGKKKGCFREGLRLGKGKDCDGPGAFQRYSVRRVQTGCEGPLMAAGLGLEGKQLRRHSVGR